MTEVTIFDSQFYGDNTQFDIKRQFENSIAESEAIDDSVSRIQNSVRTVTEPPPGVGVFDDAFFGDSTQFDLAQTTISTQDSVVGILGFVRPVIDPAVIISDQVDRLIALQRTISETISVNDIISTISGKVRVLVEPVFQIFDDAFFGDSILHRLQSQHKTQLLAFLDL